MEIVKKRDRVARNLGFKRSLKPVIGSELSYLYFCCRLNKAIKEIVVDNGTNIEVLKRFRLLHGKNNLTKFNSRIGCKRRSQM
jgi:hypothetical protein